MINRRELIDTLEKQHRGLRSDLKQAMQNAKKTLLSETVETLGKFKKDLAEHLDLENNTFYPDYLALTKANEKVKKFIDEMIVIGEEITAFLNQYDQAEKISASGDKFIPELERITETLNLRIEMEEEGLYDIYIAIR